MQLNTEKHTHLGLYGADMQVHIFEELGAAVSR